MALDKSQKSKTQKQIKQANVLEALKDVGTSTVKTFKKDLIGGTSEEFFNQLFGPKINKKYSGEVTVGESLEINDVYSGRAEEVQKLRAQVILEKNLRQEEKSRIEKRTNELRLQLQAIMQEVLSLAKTTQNLGEEVEVAAMQAPANPGVYHLIFFEKLLEFVKAFRKKIDNASVWLHASNKKAEKKNYWSMYKKKGSSFLLSPDHYLQRSAG